MPYLITDDQVRLYYEEAGQGEPIVFVHEFGGDHRSWEPQMRFFARRARCITFAARGYPPSDVPDEVERYSQERAVADIVAVMDGLGLEAAHLVGLSMGGFAALHFALSRPQRCRSIVVAGTGYGAEKAFEAYFREVSENVARQFETRGSAEFGPVYAEGAARVQFQNKDPRGWAEFAAQLSEHSAWGAANTMRGFQARRPSLYDFESELGDLRVPTLVMTGDEDDHCLQPGIFLKRTVPTAGLVVLPKSGHTLNLEEPELFNLFVDRFLDQVIAGTWTARDPRAVPSEIMKAD